MKLGRNWNLGGVRLLAEASASVSFVPSDAVRDSSSWSLLAEAATRNAATAPAPYASYEPLTVHDGMFGGRILTFHSFTAGMRRQWGASNLNLVLRARARLFIPLSRSADLVLNADILRNRSNRRDFDTTQLVLGPVLSASFGL